jgi:hypothetical protein
MISEKWWVERGRYMPGIGLPVLAFCVGKLGTYRWYGEYFLFVSGPTNGFYMHRSLVDAAKIPERVARIDSDFLRAELEHQAQGQLYAHLAKIAARDGDTSASRQPLILEKGEREDIVRLWMSGKFEQEIRKMQQVTNGDKLREYLSDVVKLEHFVREFEPGHETQ